MTGTLPRDSAVEPARRPMATTLAVSAALFVAVTAIAFVVIAIPLYTLASFEPNGLDRPFIRTGLFRVALPVGLVIGAVTAGGFGRWYRRGGRWSTEPESNRFANR